MNWWYLILAFIAGFIFGIFVIGLMTAGGDDR